LDTRVSACLKTCNFNAFFLLSPFTPTLLQLSAAALPQVKELQLPVSVLYLAEQHGKGPCDRLFGWSRAWINHYIQNKSIFNISNLEACYQQGAANMQREDPHGPAILIRTFDPGLNRPSLRKTLQCPELKISRTYSLSGELNRHATSGVSIFNHVFTDTPSRTSLSNWKIEEMLSDELIPWRKGYYDKPRSWEKG